MAAPTRYILATRNDHKATELHDILSHSGLEEIEILTLADADKLPSGPIPVVVEDTTSFLGNALLKARAVVAHTGIAAIADDSGICVDVLGGSPGIFSSRWSGAYGDDEANVELLLAQLIDMAPEHRGAHFECAAVCVMPDGREFTAVGRMMGSLARDISGEGGFGYDPIFVPEGFTQTTAEMSAEMKNSISHRAKALQDLAEQLAK